MEALFNGNIVFIFFFAIIAIFNYTSLKEFQRVTIIYITVYFLLFIDVVDMARAMLLLFLAMFCFLEILIEDETKFRIIVNPFYKIIDCVYLSVFQYAFFEMMLAVLFCSNCFEGVFPGSEFVFKGLSGLALIRAVTITLEQKFVVYSFNEMYRVFNEYPINKVDFNARLTEVCSILVAIEDRTYYERKGYTFLSIDAIKCILREKTINKKLGEKLRCTYKMGKRFFKGALKEERGYSTIPMQLIRSIGIKQGYNCKYRRKLFELLYSRMFFRGVEHQMEKAFTARRKNIKEYYLYIYFHQVNTFLGTAPFSKLLNAFDMQGKEKNKKDIYDCSNEGIFIACMGLSKRASQINEDNIDRYVGIVNEVELDKERICKMVSEMMDQPYDGNYLE